MLDAEVSPGFRIKTYIAPDTIPADFICRVLRIPNDFNIQAAVLDVLAYLSRPYTWEADSEAQEIQMRAHMAQMIYSFLYGDCDDPMIGELRLFVVSILPSNVLPCDGSTYNQGDYPTLAAVLPASLKDDVEGTFTTPNFVGRFPLGVGGELDIADTGGEAEHTLTFEEMPAHNHEFYVASGTPAAVRPLIARTALNDFIGGYFTENAGDDQPHNNMPPFFVVKIGIVAR